MLGKYGKLSKCGKGEAEARQVAGRTGVEMRREAVRIISLELIVVDKEKRKDLGQIWGHFSLVRVRRKKWKVSKGQRVREGDRATGKAVRLCWQQGEVQRALGGQ